MTPIPIGEIIGTWLGVALTLAIFSFLYKDNPLFKVGESIFLGAALGYTICLTYYSSVWPKAVQPLWPAALGGLPGPKDWSELVPSVIVPIILGLFVLLRMIPSLSWLSRYSFAIYIAGWAGITIPSSLYGQLMPQITSMMAPINGSFSHALTQVILLLGLTATVIFFFFSLEHKGVVGRVSRIGVLFVMISFGASFGYTVMGRVSLLIGRFQFLYYDWILRFFFHRGA